MTANEKFSVGAGVILLVVGWAWLGSAVCGWLGAIVLLLGL